MEAITPRISPIQGGKQKTERQRIEEADMDMPEVSAPAAAPAIAPSVAPAPVSAPVPAPVQAPAPTVPEIKPIAAQPAPEAPQPTAPAQSGMRLFKDETEAYQKMMDSGLDDATAQDMIKQRRSDLMGGNTQLKQSEAAALLKMREAGLDAKTAIKLLTDKRNADEAARPAWKKAGEGALNLAAGNLQTIAQYGGNALDFLTGGKLGAGEDVKQMLEQNKKDFGDSAAFTVGTYAPDVAATVAPGGALLKGGKAVAQGAQAVSKAAKIVTTLGKSAAVGGAYGAVTPVLNKGSEATAGDIGTSAAIGTAAGIVLPIVGKGVQKAAGKAWQYVSKVLPERLQLSGQLNNTDLKEVSKRISKLTGKEVEANDAQRWLLDREVRGSLEQQRKQVQKITTDAEAAAEKLIESKTGDVANTKVAANVRKGLSEMLGNFAKKNKDGTYSATAGNEAMLDKLQGLIDSPTMTLKQLNEARRIIGNSGIFRETGDLAQDASKKGLQNVWKEASAFLDEKIPGFRQVNKDIEVSMALNDAMLSKEVSKQTLQTLAYLGLGGGTGGAIGAVAGGDLESTVKGAAVGFGIGQLSKALNSPAFKSRLAFILNKLSPEARKSIEQLKKGVEIEPEQIKLVNNELKGLNLADLAVEGNVSKKAAGQAAKKVGKPKVEPLIDLNSIRPRQVEQGFAKGVDVSVPGQNAVPQFGDPHFANYVSTGRPIARDSYLALPAPGYNAVNQAGMTINANPPKILPKPKGWKAGSAVTNAPDAPYMQQKITKR